MLHIHLNAMFVYRLQIVYLTTKMADEVENDDQWLYGDTPDLPNIDNEKIEEEAEEEEEEERAATPNNDEEQDKPEEPEIENVSTATFLQS